MFFKKRVCFSISLLLCVVLIAALTNKFYKKVETTSESKQKPQIILDAGHGGLTNTIKV